MAECTWFPSFASEVKSISQPSVQFQSMCQCKVQKLFQNMSVLPHIPLWSLEKLISYSQKHFENAASPILAQAPTIRISELFANTKDLFCWTSWEWIHAPLENIFSSLAPSDFWELSFWAIVNTKETTFRKQISGCENYYTPIEVNRSYVSGSRWHLLVLYNRCLFIHSRWS